MLQYLINEVVVCVSIFILSNHAKISITLLLLRGCFKLFFQVYKVFVILLSCTQLCTLTIEYYKFCNKQQLASSFFNARQIILFLYKLLPRKQIFNYSYNGYSKATFNKTLTPNPFKSMHIQERSVLKSTQNKALCYATLVLIKFSKTTFYFTAFVLVEDNRYFVSIILIQTN